MNDYTENKILQFMTSQALKPVSQRDIAKKIGIKGSERSFLPQLLKDMESKGLIVKISGNRYGIPTRMNLVIGKLDSHPKGFGFVTPNNGGNDIFVNPQHMKGAMHGDKVAVRIDYLKKKGKKEGSIVRIISRGHKTIMARLERSRGVRIAVPCDKRIIYGIIVPNRFLMGAACGDIVEVKITRWQTEYQPATGKVIRVIGDHNDPAVEIEVIARIHNIAYLFPDDVVHEASLIPKGIRKEDLTGRVDLRDAVTFTIDGEDAKDFDDAVSIKKTKSGYRLWVSIADVNHYVKKGSSIDKEAFKRGTSIYFPGKCIPMLPEELSNGICSLIPGADRLSFTAQLDFDLEGRKLKQSFYKSVINSNKRLTYVSTSRILNGVGDRSIPDYKILWDNISLMGKLSGKLRKIREMDGSIDFDLPEPYIVMDAAGNIDNIVRSERTAAHTIIEEFMLAANRSVAEYMTRYPFIFRVHDRPDRESIDNFLEFIHNIGYEIKGDSNEPSFFQKIISVARGKPEERIVNHMLLRSLKQARYSTHNTGHFGLAFESYTHFTSPIRRYPDLVVHRLLEMSINRQFGKRYKDSLTTLLPPIAKKMSELERTAVDAERDMLNLKKAQFMSDKVGEDYCGIVSGVTSFGIFIELDEYFIEGIVRLSGIDDDYYIYNEKNHSLTGSHTGKRYSIGKRVRVLIESVDLERKEISMRLMDRIGGKSTRRQTLPQGSGNKRAGV